MEWSDAELDDRIEDIIVDAYGDYEQLASALGIAEQQVQRYEPTGYRSASLARIGDVVAALDIDMSERAELRDPDAA